MDRFHVALVALFYVILEAYGANTNVKFEAVLENMTDCASPQPPFTNKRIVIFEFKIHKVKGRTYLSGKNRVLEEVPFLNYSSSSYRVSASGAREELVRVDQSNCRSFMGKTFLVLGNFHYNKSNCRLLKGTSIFKDFDLDKISHSLPSWHLEGNMVHQVSLVASKRTVFCLEVFVSVKILK